MLKKWNVQTKEIGQKYEHSLTIHSAVKTGNTLVAQCSENGTELPIIITEVKNAFVVSIPNFYFSYRTPIASNVGHKLKTQGVFGWVDAEAVDLIIEALMADYWNEPEPEYRKIEVRLYPKSEERAHDERVVLVDANGEPLTDELRETFTSYFYHEHALRHKLNDLMPDDYEDEEECDGDHCIGCGNSFDDEGVNPSYIPDEHGYHPTGYCTVCESARYGSDEEEEEAR